SVILVLAEGRKILSAMHQWSQVYAKPASAAYLYLREVRCGAWCACNSGLTPTARRLQEREMLVDRTVSRYPEGRNAALNSGLTPTARREVSYDPAPIRITACSGPAIARGQLAGLARAGGDGRHGRNQP